MCSNRILKQRTSKWLQNQLLYFTSFSPLNRWFVIATVVICYCHLHIIASEMIAVIFVCLLDVFFDGMMPTQRRELADRLTMVWWKIIQTHNIIRETQIKKEKISSDCIISQSVWLKMIHCTVCSSALSIWRNTRSF